MKGLACPGPAVVLAAGSAEPLSPPAFRWVRTLCFPLRLQQSWRRTLPSMTSRKDEASPSSPTIGLAEEMAMESGAVIDRSVVEASRRPFRTGGEVENSQQTALRSREALEDMAEQLAHASPGAAAAKPTA
ncbi:hypothetical protein ABPG77_005043 [Micractinium sp. CCAP 211/92]